MGLGMRSARIALALLSAGVALTVFGGEADAKDRYCRKEHCVKRAPPGCSGLWCVPRIGRCLQTGVRLVKC